MNLAILSGRLTKEPELRYTPNGVAVCTFTLAVDRRYKDQDGSRKADFFTIVVWRKLAEICADNLKKGRLVIVEGSIQIRSYEQDESKKYVTEIMAESVEFGPKGEAKNDGEN